MLSVDGRFKESMKALLIQQDKTVAIACSGGPDSLALALLAKDWAKAGKGKIVAIIVDHGLRRESAAEAKKVAGWLKKNNIASTILVWKGRKPRRNIQEAARNARYKLLSDYCKAQGMQHLLVAHHREDQAETFLLRLARGSGVDGLSAMAALTRMHDVTLARPLLGFTKEELLAYLKKRKQAYISDPSNENPAFDRVKMRQLLPTLAEVGLTAERLAKTAAIMARARAHLEEETGRFLNTACRIFPEGYARLDPVKISEEIALRALATLIMIVGGNDVRTRMSDLERLHAALKAPAFKGATLGGCVFTKHKGATVIYRELRLVAGGIGMKMGQEAIWDNRFSVKLLSPQKGLRVGALTQAGWLKLSKALKLKSPCPNKNILYSLPCLRDARGQILAVPQLKFFAENVRCEAAFKGSPSAPSE